MLLGLAVSAQGMRAAPDIVCLKGNMRKLLHLGLPRLGAHTLSSECSEINIKSGNGPVRSYLTIRGDISFQLTIDFSAPSQ